ncbi:hypothetical protein [Saccharothrix longispora]|uniref:hypothetical protein n=1 Tax=Saccharothrix longispora TaxID=33920 RepID=UPI0028FD17A1|nr:hypothetical protein [Saccharothrix longispora]MDU0288287.1 hypothetical protein [Saccharothrix longispora]
MPRRSGSVVVEAVELSLEAVGVGGAAMLKLSPAPDDSGGAPPSQRTCGRGMAASQVDRYG